MRRVWWVGLCLAAIQAPARAQSGANITLQLPSFTHSGVNTTVIVPDRGTASLSGSGRASSGTSRFNGRPRGRGTGLSRQAGGAAVAVQIHDLQAADAALLEQARDHRAAAGDDFRGGLRDHGNPAAIDPALPSVADIERLRARRQADRQREVRAAIARGRRAYAAGKTSVAAMHWRTAARQADGALRAAIERQLRLLADESKNGPVNPTSPR